MASKEKTTTLEVSKKFADKIRKKAKTEKRQIKVIANRIIEKGLKID